MTIPYYASSLEVIEYGVYDRENGGLSMNTGYYNVAGTIKTIDDLKKIFPDGEADDLNWCLFSTSGVHGTYLKLKDLEELTEEAKADGEDYVGKLTVLVILPRIVRLEYGNISITPEDYPYIRKLAASSVEEIKKSQIGNL